MKSIQKPCLKSQNEHQNTKNHSNPQLSSIFSPSQITQTGDRCSSTIAAPLESNLSGLVDQLLPRLDATRYRKQTWTTWKWHNIFIRWFSNKKNGDFQYPCLFVGYKNIQIQRSRHPQTTAWCHYSKTSSIMVQHCFRRLKCKLVVSPTWKTARFWPFAYRSRRCLIVVLIRISWRFILLIIVQPSLFSSFSKCSFFFWVSRLLWLNMLKWACSFQKPWEVLYPKKQHISTTIPQTHPKTCKNPKKRKLG